MTVNAIQKREARAKIRAERAAAAAIKTPQLPDLLPPEEEAGLVIEVVANEEEAKKAPSLKERIMSNFQSDPKPAPKKTTARGGRPAKSQENLLATVLPAILGSFLATFSQDRLPDPYKPCAPSQEEASAIFAPLMAILGRQVEITGKASQTVIDLMNSLVCAMLYGTRAYMTYMAIKRNEEEYAGTQNVRTGEPGTPGTDTRAAHRNNGHQPVSVLRPETQSAIKNDDQSSGADVEDGDAAGKDREAELFREMFARDRLGRTRLGLLPG